MNNEIKFKNLEELYKRILPALKSKVKELNNKGYTYIHEEDVWNYLRTYKWLNSSFLDLGTMVNDCFNINDKELNNFVLKELNKYHREYKQEG